MEEISTVGIDLSCRERQQALPASDAGACLPLSGSRYSTVVLGPCGEGAFRYGRAPIP